MPKRSVLFLSLILPLVLIPAASAAPMYTIQPLIDVSKPDSNFRVSFRSFGYTQISNSSPTYLAGATFAGQAALGSLFQNNFQFQTLPALPGLNSVYLIGPMADGTAVGISYNNGSSPSTGKLTRWTNGVPFEVPIQDPANPSATFAVYFSGVNSKGEIAGTYSLNGQSSVYLYNLNTSALEIIPIPNQNASPVFVLGLNNAGNILTLGLGPSPSVWSLYDPIQRNWQQITNLPGTFSRPEAYLAANGAFAASATYFSNDSGVPVAFINGSYVNLLNPPPSSALGPRVSRNVFGYNSAGTAIGSTDNVSGLWLGGVFFNVADLIVNPQGWSSFVFANGGAYLGAIDEAGRIYGAGIYNGQDTSFVLTPVAEVPEPATAALLAIGLIGLIGLTARRHIR